MKKLRFFLPLAALGLLASCSNEEVTMPAEQPTGEPTYYLSFSASAPTGTKASGDALTGAENENTVTSANVYIYSSEGSVLVSKSVTPETTTNSNSSTYDNTYVLKVPVSQTEAKSLKNQIIKIYVVGNPSNVSVSNLSNTGAATDIEADEATVTSENLGIAATTPIVEFGTDNKGKTMTFTNVSDYEIDLEDIDTDEDMIGLFKKSGNTNDYIFDTMADSSSPSYSKATKGIELERIMARIDVKTKANDIYDLTNSVAGNKLKLVQMQIVNVNNSGEYLFRHTIEGSLTSAYGVSGKTVQLFGNEGTNGSNYNWVAGSAWSNSGTVTGNTVINTLTKSTSQKTYEITSEYGITTPTALAVPGATYTANTQQYYCWGYVPENTMPTTDMMNNANRWEHATGVVFTFQVLDSSNSPITGDSYTIYMNDDSYQTIPKTEVQDTEGIYLQYFGFIKHTGTSNDPMEYGIVRNNVYQLSIGSITALPDPDKMESMYLQLQIDVKKWIQRENTFNFGGSTNN